MLTILALLSDSHAMNPEFPQSGECEWPNAITFGTWTGTVYEADGSTHQEVRAGCGGAWLGEGWFVTAAHCVDLEFEFGTYDAVVRFGDHTNNDDYLWEGEVELCERYPGSGPDESHTLWIGPDVAICKIAETSDMPLLPLVPILVPGTCENDYIREVAFGGADANTYTTYPRSPYGFGMSPVEVEVAGYGFEALGSEAWNQSCDLQHGDCPNGNRRIAESYLFHEIMVNFAEESEKLTRVLPFVYPMSDLPYGPGLGRWNSWPESDPSNGLGVLNPGDSGSPMFFQMADGSWRTIGVGSSRGTDHKLLRSVYDPDADPQVDNRNSHFAAFAPIPIYLPWMESVVSRYDDYDITPCHTLVNHHYEYDDSLNCDLSTAMYALDPDENNYPWGSTPSFEGCYLTMGGDYNDETKECAGWDDPPPDHYVAQAPTTAEIFRDFAINGTVAEPEKLFLFELGSEDPYYGTKGNDVISLTLPSSLTTVDLGEGNDTASLIRLSAGTVQVIAGAGDDTVTASGVASDLVLPGFGRDTVQLSDGGDTLVIMGGCELVAGERYVGGKGTDTLVSPLSACELAKRGIYATEFERWVQTSAASDEALCTTPGTYPPVSTILTSEQQRMISTLCK